MSSKPSLAIVAALLAVLLAGVGAPLADGAPTFTPTGVTTPSVTPLVARLVATPAAVPDAARRAALPRSSPPFLLPALTSREVSIAERTPVAEPATAPTPAATMAAKPTARPTPKPTARTQPDEKVKSTPKATAKPTSKPTPAPTPKATPKPTPTPKPAPSYEGKSKFWYPALNISARWEWYGCDYGGDPDGLGAGVYRWGCGPKSNIYLMSHAWSTFKAIRLGYHSGAMKVGQNVWYANQGGTVSQWRVKWIKRVGLDYFNATAHEWALNDSATPIMTLQTCDGSNNQFRIIVRLVPTG